MKPTIPGLFLGLCIALSSSAQITITNADMPSAGDTIRLSLSTQFTGLTPELTDSNYTWDYSTLVSSSQTVDTFVNVLSTGLYALYFSGASFAQKSNTPPLTLSGITVDYQYDFFGKNTSAYTQWGLGASVSGFPLGMVNTPKDTLYRFPLDYMNVGNTSSTFAATVPGIGYYGGERNRIDTVDGWGTLTTPYGTFSVLRVKSVVNETDSIYLTSFGFGFSLPLPQRVEYKWLANGMKIPILQINTSGGIISQVLYRDSLRSVLTGVKDVSASEDFITLFPNPAAELLTIGCDPSDEIRSLYIFNEAGEKLREKTFEKNSGAVQLNISTLAPGIYFMKVVTQRGEGIRKFIKQ